MDRIRFRAVIALKGINPYVPVSAADAARLRPGWRRPLPVCVRVNAQPDTPWRVNLMPTGDGGFYLYLHDAIRRASNAAVGDAVEIELAFDAAYTGGPQHAPPPRFEAALARDPRARANWEALPPSLRKEVLRYLAGLKSPEAQARNIDKALHVLAGGAGRFLARTWVDGRVLRQPERGPRPGADGAL